MDFEAFSNFLTIPLDPRGKEACYEKFYNCDDDQCEHYFNYCKERSEEEAMSEDKCDTCIKWAYICELDGQRRRHCRSRNHKHYKAQEDSDES